MAGDDGFELGGVDGLGYVIVHAGIEAGLTVGLGGVGRHGDDWRVA